MKSMPANHWTSELWNIMNSVRSQCVRNSATVHQILKWSLSLACTCIYKPAYTTRSALPLNLRIEWGISGTIFYTSKQLKRAAEKHSWGGSGCSTQPSPPSSPSPPPSPQPPPQLFYPLLHTLTYKVINVCTHTHIHTCTHTHMHTHRLTHLALFTFPNFW